MKGRRLAAALAALALVGGACLSSASRSSPNTTTGGPLQVFAAASLTEAFNRARAGSVTYNFAGSNALAAQIRQGAPADVFASADAKNMQGLVDAGLVERPVVFARNKLAIAVAPGNPKGISGLADLAKPGVSVVLEAAGVPAGDYTRQVLDARDLTVSPKSLETDVKSAVAKVTTGEADATVVYVTDVVAAGPKVAGIAIPEDVQPDIAYPIAVVKATKNRAGAQAFVESAVSGEVQKALETTGFLAPH
ncbi:MAG: molybdate ABC transporter substrate-binding protein [Acidimicrobiales bacterium]